MTLEVKHMSNPITRPQLATRELLLQAWRLTLPLIMAASGPSGPFVRRAGLLLVLDPSIPSEPKYNGGPNNLRFLTDLPYFMASVGEPEDWGDMPYPLVAFSKAYGCWETGHDSAEIPLAKFKDGMSNIAGGIVGKSGLIIAFSGVQAHFDVTIARAFDAIVCGLMEQEFAHLTQEDRMSVRTYEDDLTLADLIDELGLKASMIATSLVLNLDIDEETPLPDWMHADIVGAAPEREPDTAGLNA